MAPTRKSRSVNKRFSNINEVSPNKDGGTASKSGQRKRKLSDMLGSPWSEDELERFYEAYRKYAKDWKKVAGAVRNRSIEMVEALYNMNRAYLSLPEGTASVAGLKALMTDHYNSVVQEGSDSEQESNDGSVISRKPPRRGRGKFRPSLSKGLDGHFPDLLHSPSVASNYGCLTLLKKKRSGGSRPRAVGKRTPRFPVSHLCEKDGREKYLPPNKHGPKLDVDAHDDEVAHILALALAEASQRGGSPQASHTPSKRTEHMGPSPVRNGEKMRADSEMTNAKFIGNAMEECFVEGSLGSREAENGDCARDKRYLNGTEGVSTSEVQKKGKKLHRKKSKIHDTGNVNFDDVREACSGTEEGHNVSAIRGKSEMEVSGEKNERFSPQSSRRRSKRLIFGADESLAFDALQTLANLSLMMPASTIESESSVQFKEERIDAVDKSNLPGAISASNQRDKQKASGAKDTVHRPDAGFKVTAVRNSKAGRDPSPNLSAISDAKQQLHQKKSRKLKFQSPKDDGYSDSHLSEPHKIEVSAEDGKKYTSKGKRTTQITTLPKQGKPVRPLERSSSTSDQRRAVNDMALSAVQVPTGNQVNLPTKLRSRRKMVLEKPLSCKDFRCTEKNINVERSSKPHPSLYDCAFNLKEKLFYCFSSPLVRRWCAFEWFYSAIDYPWFAKREFVEYLNHVGLGHVPRLTRVEWGVIRSSLGKPRRLSEQFLREEKEKLQQYRESVRTHYTELRAGIREGLPTDLARPLSVGQRVIAIHPKTREIHDGSILTVDRNRCRVQFDRPDLGVEFVMDIDCMPLSPLENMPEALRRQHIVLDKAFENFNEPKMIGRSKDWKTGGYMKFAPNENVENAYPPSHVSSLAEPLSTLLKQATGDSINAISQAKAAASEILSAQQATCSQPCTLAQIQAREADVRALSELTRALNKKEALVLELRHMNDEVDDSLKYGDNSLKDSESFRKLYAAIFIQLKEVDDQVSSALTNLRQRNTYQVNSPPPWPKPIASSGGPGGLTSSFTHSSFDTQESGSNLAEIVESSREKAQPMVEAAIQAMLSSRDGEDALMKIRQALCMTNSRHIGADSGMAAIVSSAPSDRVHTTSVYHDQAVSCISEQLPNSHTLYSELNNDSDQTEACLVGELLSSCVATMLMIQTCTERQYPPAEVAQILDSAVTSLKPCCSQNSSIYKEMQMCMGMIKTQILALIPT